VDKTLKANLKNVKGSYPIFTMEEYLALPEFSPEKLEKEVKLGNLKSGRLVRVIGYKAQMNTLNPLFRYIAKGETVTVTTTVCWIVSAEDSKEISLRNEKRREET